MKSVLNIGSGTSSVNDFTKLFNGWKEIRVDKYVEEADVKCDITTLSLIEDSSVDVVWACHVIEHLEWYQLPETFHNIMRVLKDDGAAIIRVPDLGSIADMIKYGLLTPVYTAQNGYEVCVIDMIYGHRGMQEHTQGQNHKTGFTHQSMEQILSSLNIKALISASGHEIRAVLYKNEVPEWIIKNIDF